MVFILFLVSYQVNRTITTCARTLYKCYANQDMKLISSENIPGNISDSVQFLRSKGILVSGTDSYANIPRYSHAAKSIKQGIWVHLNSQYSDAVLLLAKPNAEIKSGLTEEQMLAIETEAKTALFKASSLFFSRLATTVLALCLISFAAYILFNIYKA